MFRTLIVPPSATKLMHEGKLDFAGILVQPEAVTHRPVADDEIQLVICNSGRTEKLLKTHDWNPIPASLSKVGQEFHDIFKQHTNIDFIGIVTGNQAVGERITTYCRTGEVAKSLREQRELVARQE